MQVFSKTLLITFIVSALSACGGGGSDATPNASTQPAPPPPQPTVQTGVLGQSPLIGMSYSTVSRSGVTNENGEFTYLEGETVSFSVGGIVIGETEAAQSITLQGMYIDSLPRNLNDFRKLIRDTRIDDFDRFFNVLTFVYSLDNDARFENGIDLSNWQDTLSSANLNFDTKAALFNNNDFYHFSFQYGIKDNLRDQALAYIYQAQNITVTESVEVSRQEQGLIARPNTSLSTVYELDEQGRWIKSVSTRDENSDQVTVSVTTQNREFDEAGKLTRNETMFDNDNDSIANRIIVQTREYDENENLISLTSADDKNNDAVVDSIQITRYEYNENGVRRLISIDTDSNNDGTLDSTRTTVFEFNEAGQQTSSVSRFDFDADGTSDRISARLSTFDEQGLRVKSINQNDNDGDGIFESCSVLNFEFDELGRDTRLVSESDQLCDEQIESVRTTQTQYNDTFDVTMLTTEDDRDNNGQIDDLNTITRVFDQQRNLLSEISLSDSGADDIEVSLRRTLNQYNEQGLLQEERRERGEDNLIEYIDVERYAYDDNNNLVELIDESFSSDQEAPTRIETTIYSRDEFGNELTSTYTRDNDNNGNIDETRTITRTYRQFEKILSEDLARSSL